MPLLISKPGPVRDSFRIAKDRGLLPSSLSSQGQREAFAVELRSKSVFSARVSNETFLFAIKRVVESITGDVRPEGDERVSGMNFAEGRTTLKRVLKALGYTPETGFPGEEGEVPPAVAGTIEDLSSDRRLNLILETQVSLVWGRARRLQGDDEFLMLGFPAYELVRLESRDEPRDWFDRFEEAGGTILIDEDGRKRMVAHKKDPVWDALGDSALFDDALDVNHPPFAFGSGMGWRDIRRSEWIRLGGKAPESSEATEDESLLPENVATLKDPDAVGRMEKLFEGVDLEAKRIKVRELKERNRIAARRAYAKRYGLTDEEVGL